MQLVDDLFPEEDSDKDEEDEDDGEGNVHAVHQARRSHTALPAPPHNNLLSPDHFVHCFFFSSCKQRHKCGIFVSSRRRGETFSKCSKIAKNTFLFVEFYDKSWLHFFLQKMISEKGTIISWTYANFAMEFL